MNNSSYPPNGVGGGVPPQPPQAHGYPPAPQFQASQPIPPPPQNYGPPPAWPQPPQAPNQMPVPPPPNFGYNPQFAQPYNQPYYGPPPVGNPPVAQDLPQQESFADQVARSKPQAPGEQSFIPDLNDSIAQFLPPSELKEAKPGLQLSTEDSPQISQFGQAYGNFDQAEMQDPKPSPKKGKKPKKKRPKAPKGEGANPDPSTPFGELVQQAANEDEPENPFSFPAGDMSFKNDSFSFREQSFFAEKKAKEPILSQALDGQMMTELSAHDKELGPGNLIKIAFMFGALTEKMSSESSKATAEPIQVLKWLTNNFKRSNIPKNKNVEILKRLNELYEVAACPETNFEPQPSMPLETPKPEENENNIMSTKVFEMKPPPQSAFVNSWWSPFCRLFFQNQQLSQALDLINNSPLHSGLSDQMSQWKMQDYIPENPCQDLDPSLTSSLAKTDEFNNCWKKIMLPMKEAANIVVHQIYPSRMILQLEKNGAILSPVYRTTIINEHLEFIINPDTEFVCLQLNWMKSNDSQNRFLLFCNIPGHHRFGTNKGQKDFELVSIFGTKQGRKLFVEFKQNDFPPYWMAYYEGQKPIRFSKWLDLCAQVANGLIPKMLVYQRTNDACAKEIHDNLHFMEKKAVDSILSNYSSLIISKKAAETNPDLEECFSCDNITPKFLQQCLKCQSLLINEGKEDLPIEQIEQRIQAAEKAVSIMSRSEPSSMEDRISTWVKAATWECFHCNAKTIHNYNRVEDATCPNCSRTDEWLREQCEKFSQ